jgi:hypothetical protein
MVDIPNTGTNGLVLTSVGNGTNASQWAVSTGGGSTTLAGDVTGPSGSNTVIKINNTALGTLTGATAGNALIWNGTYNQWQPADPTLGGYVVNVSGLSTSGQMLFWSNLGGTGQWVTTYIPTGTGSMLFWNGLSWESTSTTGIATGNVLVWNNSTSKWVPGAAPLTGDVSGTTASNQVVSLAGGQTLALTGANFPVSGSIMQYSTSTSSWTTGAAPTVNGQILEWNGFGWAQSDSTAPSNGNTLIWNSSIAPTGKWTPGNITLAGEVTGSTSSTSVVKLITYTLPVTGAINGNFLYYSSTSGKWEYGGARSGGATPSVGDVPVWNATTGWTAGPVSSTPSLSGNPTGSMFQNSTTNVTSTLALVQNMASNFVNGSVTFHGSGGSNAYSLTVPTTGYYQVDGQVYIAAGTATGGFVVSAIFVNGSEVMRANSFGTGGAAPHCGGVIALNVSDYVQLYAQIQSGTAATNVFAGSLRTFVSLSLVSQ